MGREDQRPDRIGARLANVTQRIREMKRERAQRLRVATYNVHGCVGMDGQRS
jgi:hypothetical protein